MVRSRALVFQAVIIFVIEKMKIALRMEVVVLEMAEIQRKRF